MFKLIIMMVFILSMISLSNENITLDTENMFPTRETLLLCVKRVLDLNNDGKITTDEIKSAFPSFKMPSSTPQECADFLINSCDINNDGILDMTDWNSTNACLLDTNLNARSALKQICDKI